MEQTHLEVLLEDIHSKVEMMAEGYDLLNRKIDRVEVNLSEKIAANTELINTVAREMRDMRRELNVKIDHVAADLDGHRCDTERHRGYMVAEEHGH